MTEDMSSHRLLFFAGLEGGGGFEAGPVAAAEAESVAAKVITIM